MRTGTVCLTSEQSQAPTLQGWTRVRYTGHILGWTLYNIETHTHTVTQINILSMAGPDCVPLMSLALYSHVFIANETAKEEKVRRTKIEKEVP